MSRTISLIIETVNGCNLDCRYCFLPKRHRSLEVISEEILCKAIKGTVDLGIENVQFVWHGGEPLLAGQDFYRRALNIQLVTGAPWQHFENVMQSNATLITDDWLHFFGEHNFGVGVSLDGPGHVHDKNRRRFSGGLTFETVVEKFKKLRANGCDGGICTVVSSDSINHASEIVDFFAELEAPELDFLPCVSPCTSTEVKEKAITNDQFAAFMIEAFDRWFELDNPEVQIRYFRNVIALLLGGESNFCKFSPTKCHNFLAIDFNGDVYPCDTFVGETYWKLGSLATEDLRSILNGAQRRKFLHAMESIDPACKGCQWLSICWGGCSYHRYLGDKNLKSRSIFCESRKSIFEHIAKRLDVEPPKARPHFMSSASQEGSTTRELYVEPSTACNSDCHFCAADSTRTAATISSGYFESLKRAHEEGVSHMTISGGEPTISRDLLPFVQEASLLGFEEIQLQTNGRRLRDMYYVESLIEAGVTQFGLSLHGHTPIVHETITRAPGSFKQTVTGIENIGLAFGHNPPVAVNCVIDPLNVEHLCAIVDLLIEHNVSSIKFAYLHPTGRARTLLRDTKWPRMIEIVPYVIEAIRKVEDCGKPTTTFAVEAIPFCLLKGYELYSSDLQIRPILLAKGDGSIQPFHIGSERAKGPECNRCRFNTSCLGPWKQYPVEFGWSEFTPILDYGLDECGAPATATS